MPARASTSGRPGSQTRSAIQAPRAVTPKRALRYAPIRSSCPCWSHGGITARIGSRQGPDPESRQGQEGLLVLGIHVDVGEQCFLPRSVVEPAHVHLFQRESPFFQPQRLFGARKEEEGSLRTDGVERGVTKGLLDRERLRA